MKNKFLFLIAGLISFHLSRNLFAEKRSIVYYFNNYPGNNLKLVLKNKKWQIPDQDAGDFRHIIVDKRNGFIEYLWEGGDGSYLNQYVMFKNARREIYIAHSQIISDGGTSIEFYQVKNGWGKVTARILPKVNMETLFGKAYKSRLWQSVEKSVKSVLIKTNMSDKLRAEYEKRKLEDLLAVHYYLPRYGTKIKVKVSFNHIKAYIGYDKFTQKEKDNIMRLGKSAKEVILYWNRARSVFKFK